jgi:hypothetical protein
MRIAFNLVKPDLAVRCFHPECVVVHQSAADESSTLHDQDRQASRVR